MELIDAIYHRRSVRDYTDLPVPSAMISELLDAAIQAPSATNQQPWAFGVIRGRARLEGISRRAKPMLLALLPQSLALHQRADALTNPNSNVFHGAGTLVIIYAKPAQYPANEDCCLAAQNLMLAAHGMGLGTCPVVFVRPWLNQLEIKQELDVPSTFEAVMPIVIGWPAGLTATVQRMEPEIVCWKDDHKRGGTAPAH